MRQRPHQFDVDLVISRGVGHYSVILAYFGTHLRQSVDCREIT
jgi:hypothetical protein